MARRAATCGPSVRALAQAMPVRTAAADAVLATNVLFLLQDPAAALGEMARVLRPGGRAGFLNPTGGMRPAAMAEWLRHAGVVGPPAEPPMRWSEAAASRPPLTARTLHVELGRAGFTAETQRLTWRGMVLITVARRTDGAVSPSSSTPD
jgi:ubiquinone/menaquinone biosynthesis C-methylase UbiE